MIPSPSLVAPPALQPGGCIAVVAPSSPFDRDAFDRGVARLRERYDVRYAETLFVRSGFLAGDDDRRAEELLAALRDPAVHAVVAARGGHGSTRLLHRLPPEEVRAARKLLVGFSDVTALHAAWARGGVRSIHGPMVAALGRTGPRAVERWVAAVEGRVPDPLEGLEPMCGGIAEGPLIGGNLAVLAALVGTPYAPPLDGAVLFLEDVGERPYRVDRMLTTLRHAGWLDRVAGVALGAFTECDPGPDGTPMADVLRERLAHVAGPVVSGVPAGHVDDNLELPLGAPVRLDGNSGRITFLQSAVALA
ncbi:MAG: S66 peptidase family protein [Myxococcota bacterium]